jgi:hypothetical protein
MCGHQAWHRLLKRGRLLLRAGSSRPASGNALLLSTLHQILQGLLRQYLLLLLLVVVVVLPHKAVGEGYQRQGQVVQVGRRLNAGGLCP